MKKYTLNSKLSTIAFDAAPTGGMTVDSVSAAIPKFWSNIALGALKANTVMANLVSRDYDEAVATKGDVVNVIRRGALIVNEKEKGKQIILQTPSNSKIPITLDKHKEISWLIEDVASAKAIQDAVNYVTDAAIALGNEIDKDLLTLFASCTNNVKSEVLDVDTVLKGRETLNKNLCPLTGRVMVVSPEDETSLLKLGEFTSSEWSAENVPALREAILGKKYGITYVMDQNVVNAAGARNNLLFTKDAFVLVSRPLPLPPAGSGATSSIIEQDGISIRVTSSYSQKDGGTLWTLDVLYGVAALNEEQCAVHIETGKASV